jgi:hypothetical protein
MQALLTDQPQVSAYELTLAKQMADTLHRHYPEHLWAVTVNAKQGMADVRNMALSGNWGFRLHIPAIYSASEFDKRVRNAGGELLERYRIRRGRAQADDVLALPKDFAGRKDFIHD